MDSLDELHSLAKQALTIQSKDRLVRTQQWSLAVVLLANIPDEIKAQLAALIWTPAIAARAQLEQSP